MKVPIFLTTVKHSRAKVHQFDYKTVSALFDLSDLESHKSKFFAYNKSGIFSLWDKDYLPGALGNIKQKLLHYLSNAQISTNWAKIELITCPRFLSYVFNPVSFYLLYRQSSEFPELCIAEVNNTFGETHLYFAEYVEKKNKFSKYQAKKDFHVSPFYDRQGEYEFYVNRGESSVEIRVNLIKENKTVFTSSVGGEIIHPKNYLQAFYWGLRYVWLTFPLITWQALILKFNKGLAVYKKPIPTSKWTIKKRSCTVFQKIAYNIVIKNLSLIKKGKLTLELPDGKTVIFGTGDKQASIKINDWAFFVKVLLGADIAFGECYMHGYFDTDDLTSVLEIFAENMQNFNEREIGLSKINQFINRNIHRFNFNSKTGSKKNISAHYDLGNKLFEKFLDKNLVYSSAQYDQEHQTLEQAQLNKIHTLINKSKITKDDHVLEIGSGWGAFAIETAKLTGCKLTTITLSEQQFSYVKQKVAELNLTEQIEVKLCDYRDITGKYDKIVSIEMLEAVGHENLSTFFNCCYNLLKTNGLLNLQVITFPESRYEQYINSCDWIQKYIFPGGLCPSLAAIRDSSANHFEIKDIQNIAKCYARTLRDWSARFNEKSAELKELGYDHYFQRTWQYYFSYCEAGFNSADLGTLQILMSKK